MIDKIIESEHYYVVEVEEILQKLVAIKATSEKEAIRLVKNKYKQCSIVLKDDDLKETNYSIYTYSNPKEVEDLIKDAVVEDDWTLEILSLLKEN